MDSRTKMALLALTLLCLLPAIISALPVIFLETFFRDFFCHFHISSNNLRAPATPRPAWSALGPVMAVTSAVCVLSASSNCKNLNICHIAVMCPCIVGPVASASSVRAELLSARIPAHRARTGQSARSVLLNVLESVLSSTYRSSKGIKNFLIPIPVE